MKLSRFVALLGSVITLVQIILLVNDQEALCLNEGCSIVDSLTTIGPVYFNLGGLMFFQAVFWGNWIAGRDAQRRRYVNIILLAGLAAEGVLVSFQHYVAQVFCSYCLIILAFVILLNMLAGVRHIIGSTIVFGAVLAGFASLQFSGYGSSPLQDLDLGTYAIYDAGAAEQEKRYLFFSANCKYCEEIIGSMQEWDRCTIRFNPIEEIGEFSFPEARVLKTYQPSVNRTLLSSFSIDQIPVLLISSTTGIQVIKGAGAIQENLNDNCKTIAEQPAQVGSSTLTGSSIDDLLPPVDDGCSVSVDCEDPEMIPKTE